MGAGKQEEAQEADDVESEEQLRWVGVQGGGWSGEGLQV